MTQICAQVVYVSLRVAAHEKLAGDGVSEHYMFPGAVLWVATSALSSCKHCLLMRDHARYRHMKRVPGCTAC